MRSRIELLLSDAPGYHVAVDVSQRNLTKRERLEKQLLRLESRQRNRIRKGRTKGAGAGGFNRDVDNIVHQITLVRYELSDLNKE